MLVARGYKTELDPNNKQRTLLAKNAGAARYAYNWALEIKRDAMAKREKIPNAIELHRRLKANKFSKYNDNKILSHSRIY